MAEQMQPAHSFPISSLLTPPQPPHWLGKYYYLTLQKLNAQN